MAGSRSRRPDAPPGSHHSPLRLRIPAALAITLLGGGAILGSSFVSCEELPPEPVDAGKIFIERDAGNDGQVDARIDDDPDGPFDAAIADAYAPPDTPVG